MAADQTEFREYYHGRTGRWYEWSYMRAGKNLRLHRLLEQQGVSLKQKTICDIGFGSGSFLRRCPKASRLWGFEIDPPTVRQTKELLISLGYDEVALEAISEDSDTSTMLPEGQADLLVVSHVLEHLPDPVAFLRNHRRVLSPQGLIVGLVPMNETRDNPRHLWKIDRNLFDQWVTESGYTAVYVNATDAVGYWLYGLNLADGKWAQRLAQVVRLAVGMVYVALPGGVWDAIDRWLLRTKLAKPAQLVFILRP